MRVAEKTSGLSELLLKWAEVAAVPVTIVSSLLVYTSWVRTRSFYGYFGLDSELLQLSVTDYLLRSVDGTFGILAQILLVAVTLLALALIIPKVEQALDSLWRKRIRTVLPIAVTALFIVGVLISVGIIGTWGKPEIAPYLLGLGAFGILRSNVLSAQNSPGSTKLASATLYAAIALSVIWSATLYAQAIGQDNAKSTERSLNTRPRVTIFSPEHLDIPGSLVSSQAIAGPDGHTYYRYSGMRLFDYSNGRWFLVTGVYSENYR